MPRLKRMYVLCPCCGERVVGDEWYCEGEHISVDAQKWFDEVEKMTLTLMDRHGLSRKQASPYAALSVSAGLISVWEAETKAHYLPSANDIGDGDDLEKSTTKRRDWVYFIQSRQGGPIKIGVSVDPETRLKSFSHPDLVILATIPGGYSKEAELHHRFAHLRQQGEWFEDAPELVEFIRPIIEQGVQMELL